MSSLNIRFPVFVLMVVDPPQALLLERENQGQLALPLFESLNEALDFATQISAECTPRELKSNRAFLDFTLFPPGHPPHEVMPYDVIQNPVVLTNPDVMVLNRDELVSMWQSLR